MAVDWSRLVIIHGFVRALTPSCRRVAQSRIHQMIQAPILCLSSEHYTAHLIRAIFLQYEIELMAILVMLRKACMRGHKYIVLVIVFDCANSPLIFQMFTNHKFLIKGLVQATSEVKCHLMSSMATIF